MSHPLQLPNNNNGPAPSWPNFSGTPQLVGTSPSGRTTVYVDPSLSEAGLQNAQDLLADADRINFANDKIFGTVGGSSNVIVWALNGSTNGTGGGDHNGCDFATGGNIEVSASFGNSMRVSALYEAELSECCMNENLCGISTGEGLSRWCSMSVYHNSLSDFKTGPTWFGSGMPDWVNTTFTGTPAVPGDGDPVSTGCTMVFLSWLQGPIAVTGIMPFSLTKIAPAMVSLGNTGTLAELYEQLTGDSSTNAYPKFIAAVQNLPNGVNSDDPFGGLTQI